MYIRLFLLLLHVVCLTEAKVEITDANVATMSRDDIGMIFFITVHNTDLQSYVIKVHMVECTEIIDSKDRDSGFMYLMGGHMGVIKPACSKNITVIYPNMYLHNRRGFCLIALKFKSESDRIITTKANITFDTWLSKRVAPAGIMKDEIEQAVEEGSVELHTSFEFKRTVRSQVQYWNRGCGKNRNGIHETYRFAYLFQCEGYATKNEIRTCRSVDLDPLNKCEPVDCHMKYLGTRNYFSKRWQRCQKVPVCVADPTKDLPDVIYTLANNKCRDMERSVSKLDLQQIESGTARGKCDEHYTSLLNINCHFGKMNEATGTCDCEEGWMSAPAEKDRSLMNLFTHHMCNIEINSWYDRSSRRIKMAALLIGVLAVVIAMLIILFAFVIEQCYNCIKSFENGNNRNRRPKSDRSTPTSKTRSSRTPPSSQSTSKSAK